MVLPTAPLRILLADESDVIRRGLRNLLEEAGWRICGQVQSGQDLLLQARNLLPDVALVDLSMRGAGGATMVRQLRQLDPPPEILVFTNQGDRRFVREALAAGARGYLLKSDADRIIVTAVATVAKHKPFFTAQVSETLLSEYLEIVARGSGSTRITPRQRELLHLMAEGHTLHQISQRLGVSLRSVRAVDASLRRKFGAHTSEELIDCARLNGIQLDERPA